MRVAASLCRVKKKLLKTVGLLFVTWQLELFATPQAEFLSEGLVTTPSQALSASTYARFFVLPKKTLQPFLQLGAYTLVKDEMTWAPYIAPGIHWSSYPLRCFAEHRLQVSEWRILVAAGDLISWEIKKRSDWAVFWEPYSEFLISRQERNVLALQGLSRFGVQYQMVTGGHADFYLEPFFSYWNQQTDQMTQFELRPSVRARFCQASMCWGVSASQITPLLSGRNSGFRFLATFGGEL